MQNTVNMRLGPTETLKVRRVVDELFAAPAPHGALHSLIRRGSAPTSDAFERYAAMVLRAAGAERLGEVPSSCALSLSAPGEGVLARFEHKGRLSSEQSAVLADVEEAINRLICINDAVQDAAASATPAPDASVCITFRGVDRIPRQAAYRSARIELPETGPLGKPSVSFFNEIDWRMLDNVASIGRAVFQNSMKPNMHQSVFGAYAPNGSDWDVRTRLASLLEHMELALRFACRYDCDVECQTVHAIICAPLASSLPAWTCGDRGTVTEAATDSLLQARLVYTLRLACLAACACFGSGRSIEHAHITAETHEGTRLFAAAFDRASFVKTALSAIDSGALASPGLRFDPSGVVQVLDPAWIEFESGETRGIRPYAFGDAANRIAPERDTRPLADDLAALFGAKRVCDLDTHGYFGGGSALIEEAKDDAQHSVMAAIARLEQLVDTFEERVAPPDDDASSRPLYCGSPLARIATALIADDLSVGEEAERFLETGSPGRGIDAAGLQSSEPPQVMFFRAPSALFHAHIGLSDLYQRMGDFSGAIAHADYCIALGPTTADAYFRKADILAQQTRTTEAINVLIGGLRCAISKRDCALLYYHLALLLWRIGRKADAAAVQVYASSLEGEFAERARAVLASLRKRPSSPVIVHASPLAAAREMARARIPVVPTDEARGLIAHATIGLLNANAPQAAAPYAKALARTLSHDPIIVSACRSLAFE